MLKVGLIGCGQWGKNLIREFNNLKVLNSICDLNENLLEDYKKKYPNIKTTNDWNTVLNDDTINCVCISLPSELHYSFAKKSLLSGKDVFVEKPITLNINEAEELIEIAKKHNKILMVGHILHYNPAVEKIKEIINEGKIGKIKNIISNRMNLGSFRKNENVLWSFAPHDISLVLNLVGELPYNVFCGGKDHINKNIHDVTHSILNFKDVYVNINVNRLSPYKEQKMSIVGEKGMIIFDDVSLDKKITYFPDYIEFNTNKQQNCTVIKNNGENIDFDKSKSPLLLECKHFLYCCETRNIPKTCGSKGLMVLKVIDALEKSLTQNKYVKFKNDSKKYFAHDSAIIDEGAEIGEGTKIWHFSHICKGAKIGKNCNIGQNVFISGNSIIGNNCKIQNNVSIYDGVEAEDNVFFGPSCVLTNDINPRANYSKNGKFIKTIIKEGCTLGANCTIVCGNTLGCYSFIGAGAVVCSDVAPYTKVVGNPSRSIGFVDEKNSKMDFQSYQKYNFNL